MGTTFNIPTEFLGTPEFPADYYGPANPHRKTLLLRQHILEILNQWHPYGDRAIGYQLESRYGYPKDDSTFNAVERQVRIMRLVGEIPFDWVIDESRAIARLVDLAQGTTGCSHGAVAGPCVARSACAVMVACEKHGLGGVLRQATEPWRVPLATLGGTYSHSFAGDSIQWISGYDDRPVYILYAGDFDPTGVQIPQWLHRDMFAIAPRKVPRYDRDHYIDRVKIVRLAVNDLGQARNFGGISRPTKIDKNTHADSIDWPADLDSVEVDSIPPEALQHMVRTTIEDVVDKDIWDRSLVAEAEQRAALTRTARSFRAKIIKNGKHSKRRKNGRIHEV